MQWIRQRDKKGFPLAEALWFEEEIGAYVVQSDTTNRAFVFSRGRAFTNKLCWQFDFKNVAKIKDFDDFTAAKDWSETMAKLIYSEEIK